MKRPASTALCANFALAFALSACSQPEAILQPAALLAQASAQAEPPGPFAEASGSPVRYTETPYAAVQACAELARLGDATLAITSAALVAASATAPAFCRVQALVQPNVRMDISLPLRWNGRLYMFGNGSSAGESADEPPRMATRDRALRQGFVTASTNTGHDRAAEPLHSFMSDKQKLADYGHRAVHLTVLAAKRIAEATYQQTVNKSYWDGCSTGGRQGLVEAQRYPADFDGIISGAAALDFSNLLVQHIWVTRAIERAPIHLSKLQLVGKALYGKCDAQDGLVDGLISDPLHCGFDPRRDVPSCKPGGPQDDCLTAAEADTLQDIYQGPVSQGHNVFPGATPGAEPLVPGTARNGWDVGANGQVKTGIEVAISQLQHGVFDDPSYDWHRFDLNTDLPKLDILRREVDATNPELSALRQRGGKVLMYYGWADMVLNPRMGVDYYQRAVATNGPGTGDFFRLFMVPGMFHCSRGYGPDRFDAVTAIVNWVEGGRAPARITASQMQGGTVTRTRPLCAYPQVSRYLGAGSVNDAASFACTAPSP